MDADDLGVLEVEVFDASLAVGNITAVCSSTNINLSIFLAISVFLTINCMPRM